jgi:hypothetical protein
LLAVAVVVVPVDTTEMHQRRPVVAAVVVAAVAVK